VGLLETFKVVFESVYIVRVTKNEMRIKYEKIICTEFKITYGTIQVRKLRIKTVSNGVGKNKS